ncbi:HdeD family acid-resistance protein [Roseovarius aestuariivivens]|uniref:HdeD family acid-resistance protein n=1 Tax=Roseovarius aestuariivivens TaxID=1888910 RepID=UPI00108087AB|nr:DUF308 domain-containing protein [Roseovarius aestuariivivens]
MTSTETSQTEIPQTDTARPLEELYPDWGWKGLAALGALMLIGGLLAFLNPFAASLTVELVAGFAFGVAGIAQIWLAVTAKTPGKGERWLTGALGVLLVLLAVSLLINPLAGLVTLTLMVAVLFAMMGALRVVVAWQARPRDGWGWLMAAGVLSLALSLLIVLGLPGAALGLLGLLLALDLTFSGVATLLVAWRIRNRTT